MRALGFALCALVVACSVPNKARVALDAGIPGGDDAGGVSPVDTSAPDTTIDDAPAMFSPVGQPTFQFSANEPSCTFECRIDSEVAQPCTSPYVRTLADGTHTFSVRAINPAGLRDATPAEKVWTIDTVAPDTMFIKTPPAADNSVMAQFMFMSNEANAVFDCSLDNAGYAPCTTGESFGPVNDGTHTFAVRARDRAGNMDPSPAVFAWTVDTSTPDTEIVAQPALDTPQTAASFSFVSPDAGPGATFFCALDGAAFTACTSPTMFSGLGEGAHTFAVQVHDAVGNVDPTPATYDWTIDHTPPVTTISAGPSGVTSLTTVSVTFVANEANVTFTCKLDTGARTSCTSPFTQTGLTDGTHSFSVFATDAAGNVDATPATASWTIDTTPPTVSITSGPVAGAMSGPRVTFTFTTSDGALSCSLDGAAMAPCTSPLATNLPAGAHMFAVQATDAVGNTSNPVSRAWTVACSPPDATGAAGQLHLDDTGQTLANAVTGGAPATLGDTTAVESTDPVEIAGGRFGGALAFTAANSEHAAWPAMLGASPAFTVELWAQPNAVAGTRELFGDVSGDAALRVAMASATLVRFQLVVSDAGGPQSVASATVAAGAWHHVLGSYDGASLRLWVDGVRTEVDSVTLATAPALDSLQLGGNATTAYDGVLDEVWVAQTAITTDETVLQRYCPL